MFSNTAPIFWSGLLFVRHHICSLVFYWGAGAVPQLVKLHLLFKHTLVKLQRVSNCSCCTPPIPPTPATFHCTNTSGHASAGERVWLEHVRNLWPLGWSLSSEDRWGRMNMITSGSEGTGNENMFVSLPVVALKIPGACENERIRITLSLCPSNRKRASGRWAPRAFSSSPPWTPTMTFISVQRSLNLLPRNSQVQCLMSHWVHAYLIHQSQS